MTTKPRQFDNSNPVKVTSSEPVYDFESVEPSQFERFVALAGKLVQVPKSEIDELRAKE